MKTIRRHNVARRLIVSRRSRPKRKLHWGVALVMAGLVGLYFVLKALVPAFAGLMDGVFATAVERVGKRMVDED